MKFAASDRKLTHLGDVVVATGAHDRDMTTTTKSFIARGVLVVVALAVLAAFGPLSPVGAVPRAESHVLSVSGRWVSSEPLTVTSTRSLGAAVMFDATGTSHWTGDFRGPTSFSLQAVGDATNALHGTIDETFHGTLAGIGEGDLHFIEAFRSAPDGQLVIAAVVTSGAGALSHVRGALRFDGATDPAGVGGGTYTGTLIWNAAR